MVIPQKQITQFQKEILDWYEKNKRDLPWRRTRDPYRILVSEIMSQQTQIARVVPKYESWIQVFPRVEALANAKTSEVLRYWSGLGYNRRALYLQKCAKAVVAQYKGAFPKEIEQLKKLPGIGEYTAAAIACFAFDKQVAVIDTNIRKIIILLYSGRLQKTKVNQESRVINQEKEKKKDHDSYFIIHDSLQQNLNLTIQEIKEAAYTLLPHGKAYEWNQALMDYASAKLRKEKIPIPKQSKFKDSDRYYRGQVIKVLLKEKKIAIEKLFQTFPIDKKRLGRIIAGLEKDTIISIDHTQSLGINEDS